MDLFTAKNADENGMIYDPYAPLAVRMRPRTLDEVLGQNHLLQSGQPLRRLIEADAGNTYSSVFLWGPPGIGKTTLAYLAARASQRRFVEISAVSAGVKELRAEIDLAKKALTVEGQGTILFVDEVHRFSKTQQDALLPAVENGWVTLIAATTENPSFSVISPLLSRSLLLTLHPLTAEDLSELIDRALQDERGFNGKVSLTDEAKELLIRLAGNDARRALTLLEASVTKNEMEVTTDDVERAVDSYALRYDRDGDQHYNVISAFIKSIRGSDVDAAMHYLARMLEAGEDPRFIARRLIISASEDIGMADPSALQTAVAAAQAVALIGMPEGRIVLGQAVAHLATAPKSNRAYMAINQAIADVRNGYGVGIPTHLWDQSVSASKLAAANQAAINTEETGAAEHDYLYPHDYPGNIVRQDYLPSDIAHRRYYEPTTHGVEANITQRLERINRVLGKS